MRATLFSLILLTAITARAQSPLVGSTGANGLELTKPGIVVFDPRSFNPPLNPSGDNVFQFTTIHRSCIFEESRQHPQAEICSVAR